MQNTHDQDSPHHEQHEQSTPMEWERDHGNTGDDLLMLLIAAALLFLLTRL